VIAVSDDSDVNELAIDVNHNLQCSTTSLLMGVSSQMSVDAQCCLRPWICTCDRTVEPIKLALAFNSATHNTNQFVQSAFEPP